MRPRGALFALLVALTPARLVAQGLCAGANADTVDVGDAVRVWPAPLDRRVSLELRDVSLRTALDRIAAAGGIRFSYSAEFLPLDRHVCYTRSNAPLGDALAALLRTTRVEPVVAGADHVALAPFRGTLSFDANTPTGRGVNVLDRVVVTGSTGGGSERAVTVGVDVLDGNALAQRNTTTLSQVLDASVPGLWLWEQSPTSLLSSYGSIRGASSFGVSYPKIYIDGIEVANPLLLTQFSPETVERVEVIRGPQGAALYGSDAISGVINIMTHHEGVPADGSRATFQSGVGVSQSAYASGGSFVQDHALTLRTGTDLRSFDFSVRAGSIGSYMPGAFAHQVNTRAGMRIVGARMSFTGSARFFAEDAGVPHSPFIQRRPPPTAPSGGRYNSLDVVRNQAMDSLVGAPADTNAPQSVRQYTVGATTAFAQSDRITHTLVVGVDGYRLDNVFLDTTPLSTATDSALQAARGGGDRATIRVSSVARLGNPEETAGTFTVAAEHAALRLETGWTMATQSRGFMQRTVQQAAVRWQSNTGFITQANGSFRNSLFLTSGVRFERNEGFATDSRFTTLPSIGAAAVRDVGILTMKLRTAYGKGIRAPQTPARQFPSSGASLSEAGASLAPEEQSGIETGVDLFAGRWLALHATRFDQRATGLLQQVSMLSDSASGQFGQERHLRFVLQNVGQIANNGWEFQGSVKRSRLTLEGAMSLVDSRVRRLAPHYSGDLREGDRMLGVPAQTSSLTASWTEWRSYFSLTAARATDWINYDRLALAKAYLQPTYGPRDFVGPQLRSYWARYDGYTHLRASFSRDVVRGLGLVVNGDNLLGRQVGEPDDITIVPGRTITVGLKAKF